MGNTKLVSDRLGVARRTARRRIAKGDPEALQVIRQEGDPAFILIRHIVEALALLADGDSAFQRATLHLNLLRISGGTKHLSAKAKQVLEGARAAGGKIEDAIEAAITPWHELDQLTTRTGRLSADYKTIKEIEAEEKNT